jgi:uncharacterized membrane protein
MAQNSPKTTGSQKNTGMAILGYILFFIPLLTDAKDDPFVKYHVKQGLLLWIIAIASVVIGVIPILGWIIALIVPLVVFVLAILGIINAANGEMKPVPLVGQYAEQWFKF